MQSEIFRTINNTVINIENPNTKFKINEFPTSNAFETVTIARKSFNTGQTKSIEFRKKQLKNLLRLLQENMSKIEDALEMDLGRHPVESAILELDVCTSEIIRLIMYLNEWSATEYPPKPRLNFLDKLYILSEPYGVVLVIGPWNFPINLLLGPAAGAIAAGNCVVMKPSEITKATERLIAKLVPKYLDKDCYQVFTGGPQETRELLENKFDYIFFTGSSTVGKLIHAAANQYLTPVTLELGGKNPLYLDDTVNTQKAAKRILFGKYANAGQICISPDYLLCTQEVQTKFVECAKRILKEWYDDAKSSSDYGKIVSEKHWNRLKAFIEDRENIAVGGCFDRNKCFIEPTILTNITLDDPIMEEEIFGPILPIVTIKNVNDAIKIINEREKPLVLYIFSNDKNTKNLLLDHCSSGGAVINETLTQFIAETLPFGGVGLSGMGKYHGKNSFDTFTHKKSVLEKDYNIFTEYGLNFRYPRYKVFNGKMINAMSRPIPFPSSATIHTLMTFIMGILCVFVIRALFSLISNDL